MKICDDNKIYQYWGKTNRFRDKDNLSIHLLIYHCLDAAAVGRILLKNDKLLFNRLAGHINLENEKILCLISYYLALHDVGKFSYRFQHMIRGEHSENYTQRHDNLGFCLWEKTFSDIWLKNLLCLNKNVDKYDWQDVLLPWYYAVTGHHGKPPHSNVNGIAINPEDFFSDDNLSAINSFLEEIATILMNNNPKFGLIEWNDGLEDAFKRSSWLIAGLVILSDWIGSNSDFFPPCSIPLPIEDYWYKFALPQAELAVVASGVLPSSISQNTGMSSLFPNIEKPTPLQTYVSTCKIEDGVQLFILEDSTGSGKTEAALTLAHRLMAKGLAEGIFVALPTMATANAMYGRLAKAYRKLFPADEKPSLILSHSARLLSDTFRNSIGLENSHISHMIETSVDGDTASAQCSTWLADNRKKALLANVGVGTIDQALLAVLPSNHQSLRLLGLSRSVLIVDEVHAYDPYMHTLLCELLRFHSALGGCAILLSATLPIKQRQKLIEKFNNGPLKMISGNNDFPLVTHIANQNISEISVGTLEGSQRVVAMEFFDKTNDVEKRLIDIITEGGCACWIRNTVDDAVEAYKRLSSASVLGSEKTILFHARFAMGDRLNIENRVIKTFGKDSNDSTRKGCLLIATQVVEQSLDLDFDYMISDLAPIDLVIQRAGRLHRHRRGERGTPTLGILAPLMTDNPNENWYSDLFPKAAFVYPSHGQLWLTARLLAERGKLIMPDNARYLIEHVFGVSAQREIPKGLRNRDDKAAGEAKANVCVAHLNHLKLNDGYKATINQWMDDIITPTRLGELHVTVRLARWDGRNITPWVKSELFAWELSQLSINLIKIKEVAQYEGTLKEAVEKAFVSMPDNGKWCVLIPLSTVNEQEWEGYANDSNGRKVRVSYNQITGLIVNLW